MPEDAAPADKRLRLLEAIRAASMAPLAAFVFPDV
jgi:hypothetical protein